jgi:cytochrome c peroxidase
LEANLSASNYPVAANTRACTTCHPLERGGMDGQSRAIAANSTPYLRNTPTIYNVGLNAAWARSHISGQHVK